ncbi:hypothetical protein GBAR_LOCUS25449 [Geodia barretti]|uniref:Uncharacterized protein n=1 Tax=Geodia barretti TaxID=519541 RepID=A0AA35X6H5_GEOBA|nr:hypothetical protein GBAR_LOCUS25449 [Geodia barretti]
MSRCVIAGLVLLLSATSVVGTGGDSTTDNSTECVSQQELAAVRKRVDQLHSQIHYWQSINIRNIVQDHCSSQNTVELLPTSEDCVDSALIAVSVVSLLLMVTLTTVVVTQCVLIIRMRRSRKNNTETYYASPTTNTTDVPIYSNAAYSQTGVIPTGKSFKSEELETQLATSQG